MFWLLIICAALASVLAQIIPLATYCRQLSVDPNCLCETEANLVNVRCSGEYAIQLEMSDTETNISMSYYGAFAMERLPRFDLNNVAKFEFDAYNFWPAAFLSDLLTALGIDCVAAVDFHDRRAENLSNLIGYVVQSGNLSVNGWQFATVPGLTYLKYDSNAELNETIFQDFDNLTILELRLCVDLLPDMLFDSLAHSLETLRIENPYPFVFNATLLRNLQQLRNLSLQLAKMQPKINGQVEMLTFANMQSLEELHLLSATPVVNADMLNGSYNLKRIKIIRNDWLSTLPEQLFLDQGNLTVLDLHDNFLSDLPVGLFAPLAKLELLDLSRNKLSTLSSELLVPLISLQLLNLNYNSLIILESTTFSDLRSLSFIDMRGTQFYGTTKLAMSYEVLLCTNDETCQYKTETWTCARQCICWVKRCTRELIIDCRGTELEQLPELPQTRLVQTVLKASNNSLSSLPSITTDGYANVTELYLADNQLTSIDDPAQLPANLTHLDVRRNRISGLSADFIDYLARNTTMKLSLAGNPLICDCAALPLLNFIRAQPQRVRDAGELHCIKHHKPFQQMDANEICPSYVLLIGCIVGGIVIVACLLSVVYLAYREQLKVWLYNHNCCLWWVSEEELDKDKVYDAFISYSHKDEELIEQLLPKLETGPHMFRVCLHGRDWLVGDCIPEQIVRTINDSKRVIIILSQHFIESVWARMEFRIAYQATLQDKRKRIIIILYKELEHYEGIDSELRAYLKLNTYLKWGDPLFWSKLRYAMPHNRRVLKGQKKYAGPLL